MNEIKIDLSGVSVQEFFGNQNANINKIGKYFPKIKIVARGNTLKAYGEENILEELEKILKPEIEIDKSPIKSDSDEDEEVEIPNELMKEKDYKIIVLQKIAEKLGISIFETGSKKKKLKKILYEEIKDKISSN